MKDLHTQELQQEGHDLIDRLVELGVSADRVYQRLGEWLGERTPNHFSKIRTPDQALKAVKCLRLMHRFMTEQGRFPKTYPHWMSTP